MDGSYLSTIGVPSLHSRKSNLWSGFRFVVGIGVGSADGESVGVAVGEDDGRDVGGAVGTGDGASDGSPVGRGVVVGRDVGLSEGSGLGFGLGKVHAALPCGVDTTE